MVKDVLKTFFKLSNIYLAKNALLSSFLDYTASLDQDFEAAYKYIVDDAQWEENISEE